MAEPFATTRVDVAGPILYKEKKQECKAYIVIFTRAVIQAIQLKLYWIMIVEDFIHAFKEKIRTLAKNSFIAKTPKLIVIENAKALKTTAKWISQMRKDKDIFGFLSKHSIEWKFNLSRALWWGCFVETLIGIMKIALSKQ